MCKKCPGCSNNNKKAEDVLKKNYNLEFWIMDIIELWSLWVLTSFIFCELPQSILC
jgi:hypothetical protein